MKGVAAFLVMRHLLSGNRDSGNSRGTHSGQVQLAFLFHHWVFLRNLSVRIMRRKDAIVICKQNGKRAFSIYKLKTQMFCSRQFSFIPFNNFSKSRLPHIIEVKEPHPHCV